MLLIQTPPTTGTVIAALSTSSTFVPYRNSKLTRLLKDSLGGNTKTTLLSMVGPTSMCADETIKTLRFSERATHVTQCAVRNELVSDATLLRRARLKIAQLQKELKLGLDNATEKREEREERLQRELTNKSNQLRNSKRRIRQLEKQLQSVRSIYQDSLRLLIIKLKSQTRMLLREQIHYCFCYVTVVLGIRIHGLHTCAAGLCLKQL